jgi:uroporphyrinogen-III decarboxylase
LGERGVVATGIADPVCAVADLFTLRDFALTGSRRPRVLKRLLDFFGHRIEDYARQAAEQSSGVFYRIVGPEYVTPPILPPELFSEYVVPYDKRMVDIIKRTDNIAVIHCHGKLRTVLDGIRTINPHVLEPIEPPPKGDISLYEIKQRIGDRTCLMGHIQYNDLEFDPPEKIRKKVKSAVEQGSAGGGYILFPTAEPIARISDRLLTNMKAYVSAGRAYGRYR